MESLDAWRARKAAAPREVEAMLADVPETERAATLLNFVKQFDARVRGEMASLNNDQRELVEAACAKLHQLEKAA